MRISAVVLTIVAAATAQITNTATSNGCEPHGDHWHCPAGVAAPTTAPAVEASVDTVSATASGMCEPHDDHWHCPSGVAEPTYAPSAALAITSIASGSITSASTASSSASHNHEDDEDDDEHSHAVTASTCEPHGDHWHCPSGVAQPTTAPAQTLSNSRTSTARGVSDISGAISASVAEASGSGAASTVGVYQQGFVTVVFGVLSAFFL